MSEQRVGTAVLEIKIDDRAVKPAFDAVKRDSDDTASKVSLIGTALKGAVFVAFAKIATDALGTIVGGIVDLGTHGADVDDVANSFGVLSGKAGETADTMLGQLRTGVVGTLSDFDLMTLANRALGSGLIKSAEDMGTLAAGARTLAKATGGTTKEAFDTLTSAMASGRTAALKQLGIFVDSKVAIQAYADKIGKSVAALTDAERAQGLAAATLAALRQRMKEIVPDAADFGEMINQVKVKLTNFNDELSKGVARSPVFRAGMEAAGAAISTAFGGNQTALIGLTVRAIEWVAIKTLEAARVAVEAGRFISTAFTTAVTIYNLAFEVLHTGISKTATLLSVLATAASVLPGVGVQFRVVAGTMQGLAAAAEKTARGFAETRNKSNDLAFDMHVGFNAAADAIETVHGAMVNAQGAVVETGTKTKDAIKGIGDAGDAVVPRTEAATRTIAAAYQKLQDDILLGTKVGMDLRLAELEIGKQKEITGIRELKDITATERDAMILLVQEKYRQQVDAARLGTDQIKALEQGLQQEIALLTTTGTANKLLTLDAARLKEIEGLAFLRLNYGTEYAAMLALVTEKYAQMSAAATGHGLTVQQAAAAAGIATRAELQTTADNAVALYEQMKASGLFTIAAVQKAFEDAEAAKRVVKGQTAEAMMSSDQAIQTGALQVLGVLGERNKTAAIAGAIINTYLAVSKALAAAPWPANLVLAAGALAVGMANVSRIRSSQAGGFREGTPGLDFANFGRESFQPLHGREAVIPSGKGHLLAGEIAAAMPGSDTATLDRLDRIADAFERLPQVMKRAFRDGMMQATA